MSMCTSFQTTCQIACQVKMAASSTSSSHVLLCCGILMIKNPNITSVVWDYFGLNINPEGSMISEEATFPVCRSYGKSVSAKGGNTTNVLSHLREHHPNLYSEAYPKIARKGTAGSTAAAVVAQPTLQQSIEQSAKYATHSSIAQDLNYAVMYFLAKDRTCILYIRWKARF